MKLKSHEMQLLKTAVHGGEQKTPFQLNIVLFLGGKKEKKQIRFSNIIKEDFQMETPKITIFLNKAYSENSFQKTRKKSVTSMDTVEVWK